MQVTLDAVGECNETHSFGPGGNSHTLHMPDSQRLLALSRRQLALLETSVDARTPLLASTEINLFIAHGIPQAHPSLRFRASATAADGTTEPWLIAGLFATNIQGSPRRNSSCSRAPLRRSRRVARSASARSWATRALRQHAVTFRPTPSARSTSAT